MAHSLRHVDLSNVAGVLIDIDNTLYPYEPTHQAALAAGYALWQRFDDTLDQDTFNVRYRAARTAVTERLRPQGVCRSRLLAFQTMLEDMAIADAYVKAVALDDRYWSRFCEVMTLDPDIARFLHRLKAATIPVCAVTDMTMGRQVQKLLALDVVPYIAYLVTSEEVGVEKPDVRVFEAALNKLKVSADTALMIGDHETKDIAGAEALGIRSCLVCLP